MTNAEKPYRSPWLYDVAPFEIVKDVYYVGNKNVSVHMFDTGEGLLLLDTAYTQTGYLLLESIRELGFDPHDIKWILHSHAHYDHFGFTRMLVEKYGCKTYMPEVDLEFMTTKAEFNCCAGGLLQCSRTHPRTHGLCVPSALWPEGSHARRHRLEHGECRVYQAV